MKSSITGERNDLAVMVRQVRAAAQGGAQRAPGGAVENDWCGGTFRRGSGCEKIAAAVGKGGEKDEYRSNLFFSYYSSPSV